MTKKRPTEPNTMHPADASRVGALTLQDEQEIQATVELALHQARLRVEEEQRLADSRPKQLDLTPVKLVLDGGRVLEVPQRVGYAGSLAFIDWLNFTCGENSYNWRSQPVTDLHLAEDVSFVLHEILGYGITSKRDRGLFFYRESWVLGDSFGFVCHGGQNNTILVSINGSGCTAAAQGWEKRLHDFLQQAELPRLTRVDLSYDDFTGEAFNADGLEYQYEQGRFSSGGRNPDIELRGNWKNPTGKGRTLYVGNRQNGKFFRGYEKGKQLGSSISEWFRVEVEFKSVDRFLPLEILMFPAEYLAAAYPCLNSISQRQERILTTQKTVEASYDRLKGWLHRQCGSALNFMLQVEGDPQKVLDLLIKEGAIPKGLKIPDSADCQEFLHQKIREDIPLDLMIERPFTND